MYGDRPCGQPRSDHVELLQLPHRRHHQNQPQERAHVSGRHHVQHERLPEIGRSQLYLLLRGNS